MGRRRECDERQDKQAAIHGYAFHCSCRHDARLEVPSPAVSPMTVTEPTDVLTYLFSNGGRPGCDGARRNPAAAGMLETARPLALSLVPFRFRSALEICWSLLVSNVGVSLRLPVMTSTSITQPVPP